jgi:hypothetical protein
MFDRAKYSIERMGEYICVFPVEWPNAVGTMYAPDTPGYAELNKIIENNGDARTA